MDLSSLFHPAVAAWFENRFVRATAAQGEAWPLIKAGRHTLIAAPTGSGKTFAAFMAAIDDLVRRGIAGGLKDERYPAQPGRAARRHSRRTAPACTSGRRHQDLGANGRHAGA
jgi:superfamily II DNA/RNA helicase